MKYYSEVTKEMYDTIEDLENAEKKQTVDIEKVKKEYNELMDKACDAVIAAYKKYVELLDLGGDSCDDDDDESSIVDLLINLLK